MVYVVERYLPGLSRSELLRGLLRLEQVSEEAERGAEVRYLDSTIVLRDEACFCRFEGPSSDAVAEVNRQAGLPFDRIVLAVTVHPKGAEMSTYPSIPATVEIKRGRLFGLVVGIAALTAAVTWVLSAYAFQSGGSSASAEAAPAVKGYMSYLGPHPATATDMPSVQGYMSYLGQPAGLDTHGASSIMSLTAADLAANALGTGYALPSAQKGPSVESVLASMSPQTREYTRRIMNLTFAQLAAGAAGQP
jgi:Nickel responsive protein SCO4226-like